MSVHNINYLDNTNLSIPLGLVIPPQILYNETSEKCPIIINKNAIKENLYNKLLNTATVNKEQIQDKLKNTRKAKKDKKKIKSKKRQKKDKIIR